MGVIQLADHLGVGAPAGVGGAAHPVGGVDHVHGDAVCLGQFSPPACHHVKGGDTVPGGPVGLYRHKIELLLFDQGLDVGIAVAQHRPGGGGVGAPLLLRLVGPNGVGQDAQLHPRGPLPYGGKDRIQRHPGEVLHIALVADAAPLAKVGAIGAAGLLVVVLVQEQPVRVVAGDKVRRLLPQEVDGSGIQAGGPAHGLAVAHIHHVVDAVDVHPLGPGLGDGVGQGVKEGGQGRQLLAVVKDALLPRRLDDDGVEAHTGGPAKDSVNLRLYLLLRGIPGEEILAGDEEKALHLVGLVVLVHHRRLLRGGLGQLPARAAAGVLRGDLLPAGLPGAGIRPGAAGGGAAVGQQGGKLQVPHEDGHHPHHHHNPGKQPRHQGHQLAVVVHQLPHCASLRIVLSFSVLYFCNLKLFLSNLYYSICYTL